MEPKVVLLHGFNDDELMDVVRVVKAAVQDPGSVAFASTTPTNLGWRVGELLDHVGEEHKARANRSPAGSEKG
jgi:hypothetical protein